MKYELRNISSTSKTVELNHLPVVDGYGGGDNMLSEGAVFKDKQWMGQCLALAPELPDTLFMTFFPYWDDSEPMHYFDIEINGELFDLSSVSKLTETQNFPPEAIGLTNYIKLYHTGNGWARLFVRNVTNEPLHVKFIRRNDWRSGTGFDDKERATLKLMDDRRNPSIRYHADESFEFDLAPYVPFDQVPEKDKMILELDFQEDGDDLEWLYLEIINQDDVHKDDYVFIDWGNGSTDHIKFIEQGTDSSSDFMETYAFWERAPDRSGQHTIKLHCSHPFQYLMIMNVAKVIQWGSYIAEEIYGFAVRWGSGPVLESLPNEKMPEWITWIDFDEEYQEEMKFKVQNLDVPFTMSYINYNGQTRVWNGYGRVDKFLDYNNYTGEINDIEDYKQKIQKNVSNPGSNSNRKTQLRFTCCNHKSLKHILQHKKCDKCQ